MTPIHVPPVSCEGCCSSGGGGQDLSEIVTARLNSVIGSVASGTVITAAAYNWTTEPGFGGGAAATFDAVNKRVEAAVDGRYRVTWSVYQDADSTLASTRIQHGISVTKNGVTQIGYGQATSQNNASSSEVTEVFTGSRIIDMDAGDDVRISVSVSATGTTDVDVNPAAGPAGTFVQLEYLGPTPAP